LSKSIFKKDAQGNIIFYRWKYFGKFDILNNLQQQKELEKLVEKRNLMFYMANAGGVASLLFIPIILLSVILSSILYFILKYIGIKFAWYFIFIVAILFMLVIILQDYSKQVDKILNNKE
jgi:uncharacterized membrane protein